MNFNEYFQYNSETGVLIWMKSPAHKIKIGDVAGYADIHGYLKIQFNGKKYRVHRLAWYLHYEKWPTGEIDHINGIKTDNRINNLKDVTHTENMNNTKGHREKTYKYYYFNKKYQVWQVKVTIDSKMKHLGNFETEEKARQFIENNIHLFLGAKLLECKI
jgi:hypothetical protein